MNKILLAILFFAYHYCPAQLTGNFKTIAEFGKGMQFVELSQSPDTKEILLYFQNREMEVLTDLRHICFANKDSFMVFIADLKLVDVDHTLHRNNYMISEQKQGLGSLFLWVFDADRNGYFRIPAKNIKKFEDAATKLQ